MHNSIFYIILAIIIINYLLERFLDYLNLKHIITDLPPELKDVYDKERYHKSQVYKSVNTKFSFITTAFSLILILAMLFLGGFGFVNDLAYSISEKYIFVALIFFGILFLVSDILSVPFSVYDTFVIETKFGFNKTTVSTFIKDKLKSWLLAITIGGGLLALIIWFYMLTGPRFWIFTWIAISVFTIFMTMFYSNIIVPLFNKQTPLAEGSLRQAIEAFSQKAGFKLTNIYVIDGSKRSTKANAYFTGLGSKKRIVLYDTLVNDLSEDEIVAVLAHEIGHYKKKHTLTGTVLGIIQMGLTLFILSLLLNNPKLSEAMGVGVPNFHISLIAFAILYSPVSLILGLLMHLLSRKNEYAADKFATINYNGEALISALKKLSEKNLSNLTPHPLYVFFHYSHPTLLQRIRNIRSLK